MIFVKYYTILVMTILLIYLPYPENAFSLECEFINNTCRYQMDTSIVYCDNDTTGLCHIPMDMYNNEIKEPRIELKRGTHFTYISYNCRVLCRALQHYVL